MGLFNAAGGGEPARRRPDAAGLSIIASDLTLQGDLETSGVVKIEGQVRGNVSAAEQVLVAAGATVEGDLQTREAVIGGVVRGSVFASGRVEVLPSAVVTGNITTARLLIHEGGTLNGEIVMQLDRPAEVTADSADLPRLTRAAVGQ